MSAAEHKYVRINDEVVWESSDGEVRAFQPVNGQFLTLNETGSFIWNQIARTSDLAAAMDAVVESYAPSQSLDGAMIRESSLRFVDKLRDEGYLILDTE